MGEKHTIMGVLLEEVAMEFRLYQDTAIEIDEQYWSSSFFLLHFRVLKWDERIHSLYHVLTLRAGTLRGITKLSLLWKLL